MKKLWITLGVILGVVIVLIGGGFVFANYLLDSTLNQVVTTEGINREEANISENVMEKEKESNVVNIAVFGLDQNGDGSDGRSDAMKVLSLDMDNKTAKVTSLQRDTLIYIPGEIQDFDKLNHAYAYGGANLSMQTINYNFDLDLTRYVSFNFDAIEKIIDTIGGVEINIKDYEVPYARDQIKSAGLQMLSGKQAMAYMRIRYADSDYVRMERQTTVMKAIFAQLKQTSYTQLLSLLNDMLPYIETNLTKDEIINLGLDALKIDLGNIEQYQIPTNGYSDINHSVSYKGYSPLYVMNSYQTIVREVHQNIYGDKDYQPSDTVLETEAAIYEKFGYTIK
ncbi:LCP family protein [Turicibacter sanguinis]|uniref:LCP family protein n=1 Tax=Turicibacter sanguinis TaxID=154288 RepID=UPI0018A97123|nr:LCP family protein [Turicibacter sanguinis]MDB8559597.1 LCP family protein [Turicibacter sanguinis]MDB8561050.1 LCP family protein [Turicibacter sanguinis]